MPSYSYFSYLRVDFFATTTLSRNTQKVTARMYAAIVFVTIILPSPVYPFFSRDTLRLPLIATCFADLSQLTLKYRGITCIVVIVIQTVFARICTVPAEFAVRVLEAGSEYVSDVGHVEQHERDAHQGVQDGRQLAHVRLRGQVAVT